MPRMTRSSCHLALTRNPLVSYTCYMKHLQHRVPVIPAQAGTHVFWPPAFAGVTSACAGVTLSASAFTLAASFDKLSAEAESAPIRIKVADRMNGAGVGHALQNSIKEAKREPRLFQARMPKFSEKTNGLAEQQSNNGKGIALDDPSTGSPIRPDTSGLSRVR